MGVVTSVVVRAKAIVKAPVILLVMEVVAVLLVTINNMIDRR